MRTREASRAAATTQSRAAARAGAEVAGRMAAARAGRTGSASAKGAPSAQDGCAAEGQTAAQAERAATLDESGAKGIAAQGCGRANAQGCAERGDESERLETDAGFAAALRAEALKGRRGAPRKIALLMPLPFCLMGALAGGIGGGGAVGAFSTYGWNWWYALPLPIAIALIATSVANLDARQKLRPVLGLPVPPARTWWAKTAYALALVFAANLVVLAASVLVRALGGAAPSVLAGLATAAVLTAANAWAVPASLALATRFGPLAGIALPALAQLGLGIGLWTSPWWFLLPPTTALVAASPLVGVAPSGVPLAPGDALGTFGWETAAGLFVALALFAALATAGARWYARRKAR